MFDKVLRTVLYAAVVGLCLMRGWSYWQSLHPAARPTPQAMVSKLIGTKVDLQSVSAEEKPKATLVIGMTTSCIYCKASAPFYQKLLANLPAGVRTIAVLPEDNKVATAYVQDSLDLKFNEVMQKLPGLSVAATPTLLLLDGSGVVKGAWVGLQKPDGEHEIVEAFNRAAGAESPAQAE